ncbi:hypothetical protein L3Q82_023492 [Scortum barcoo]|uniref:Uncharacterized protein n=1 Tax=Scortum barcoo TaxID=214431 RepID=A0ACB8WT20_9TELE|nr:hypothetical protein L3Q82_023492 [Scortum barcoo]
MIKLHLKVESSHLYVAPRHIYFFWFYARKQHGSSAHAYILKYDLHNGPTSKMAGASDPLEDMLFTELDEKAVSDLVGSLESQLGDSSAPAAGAPPAARHFSGKEREDPQQGHPGPGVDRDPAAKTRCSSTSSAGAGRPAGPGPGPGSGSGPGSGPEPGPGLQTSAPTASPAPGPGTLPAQPAAAAPPRAAVPAPGSAAPPEQPRSAPPGSQSLNGGAAVKLVNSAPPPAGTGSVISAVSAAQQSSGGAATLHRLPGPPSVAQNGMDPKGVHQGVQAGVQQGAASPSGPPPQVNHSSPLMHAKVLVPSQPPPSAAPTPVSQTQTGTAAGGAKPAVNGLGQPAGAVVRPPGAPVAPPPLQQQRPGLVTSSPRAAAPQPPLAVRPQQQTTIQLPPGFTMPPGMVLVRTETGQLVMVPQQVLAQAQAKTQQGQTVANITQRPAAPTAGATIRVSTATTAPQTVRLASPAQTRMVQPPSTTVQKAITVAPGGTAVSVKMTTPQKAQTVITAGGAPVTKPAGVLSTSLSSSTPAATSTAAGRVTVVSQVESRYL